MERHCSPLKLVEKECTSVTLICYSKMLYSGCINCFFSLVNFIYHHINNIQFIQDSIHLSSTADINEKVAACLY